MIVILRWIVAIIFLQTLFFKFSGSPESVHIFETVGMEPAGRYLTALGELLAAVLLIWPAHYRKGALLSILIIGPAIVLHLTVLGIEVQNDSGLLFGMACLILAAASAILLLDRLQSRRQA